MRIFGYVDYVRWIKDELVRGQRGVGSKARLAEAAGCQASYLTLVLKDEAHLTLEQAERLGRYWKLAENEKEYFILLVSFARAGTKELKMHFSERMNSLKETHENLGKRIKQVELFPDEQAAVYYSNWLYLAVHILISIPAFQTVRSICARLQADEASVNKVLRYLEQLGFAKFKSGEWTSTGRLLHLPRESPFISLHHSHWRQRAVDSAFTGTKDDIHYTAVNSLSKKDIDVIRQLVLDLIDRSREVILPSAEEELICMNFDVFKV